MSEHIQVIRSLCRYNVTIMCIYKLLCTSDNLYMLWYNISLYYLLMWALIQYLSKIITKLIQNVGKGV